MVNALLAIYTWEDVCLWIFFSLSYKERLLTFKNHFIENIRKYANFLKYPSLVLSMNKFQRKFQFSSLKRKFSLLSFLTWWISVDSIFHFSNQLTSNQLATNHHSDIGGIEKKEIRTLSAFTSHHFLFEKFILCSTHSGTLCVACWVMMFITLVLNGEWFFTVLPLLLLPTGYHCYVGHNTYTYGASLSFARLTINILKGREMRDDQKELIW